MDNANTTEQQIPIPDEIRTYLNSLLDASGMKEADSVTREKMVQELFLKLDDYIIDKVVEYMPAEKLDDFTNFMQTSPSKEAVEKYIQENVPDSQDVFTVAFADFR